VENLKVRRRRLNRIRAVPACTCFRRSDGRCDLRSSNNDGQVKVVIDGLFVVEVDLLTLAAGILLGRRFFRLAMAIRRAAAFRAGPHKVVVAGDAAAPNKGA